LNRKTAEIAYDADSRSRELSGYADIRLSSNHIQDSAGGRFNGHRVDKNTIACGAPKAHQAASMTQFADVMLKEKVSLIMDLRTPEQIGKDSYRPTEKKVYGADGQSVSFKLLPEPGMQKSTAGLLPPGRSAAQWQFRRAGSASARFNSRIFLFLNMARFRPKTSIKSPAHSTLSSRAILI
jgi:hypothetical protein